MNNSIVRWDWWGSVGAAAAGLVQLVYGGAQLPPAFIPWDEIGDLPLGLLGLCCCKELTEDLRPGDLPS